MTPAGRELWAAWKGRSHAEWRRFLGVPDLELYRSLPSTNAHLLERAASGLEPFSTVVAGVQTRGRGRLGRRWHSPEGAGLWMSVFLPVEREGEVGVLPLAVGAAAASVLERFANEPVGLKWPNDVLFGDRKVAGILCEAVAEPGGGVVVGIGVNVRRPGEGYPADLAPGIAVLEEESGGPVREPELARALIDAFRQWVRPLPERLAGRLREEWERRDRLRGREVHVDTGVSGRVLGVSEDGSLELVTPGGRTVAVRAGSVRILERGDSPALHRVGSVAEGLGDPPRGGNAEEKR